MTDVEEYEHHASLQQKVGDFFSLQQKVSPIPVYDGDYTSYSEKWELSQKGKAKLMFTNFNFAGDDIIVWAAILVTTDPYNYRPL